MSGDIDLLICQLRDGRARTRSQAARTLAENPSPLAKKDLVRLLGDTDDEVRYWATVALSSLRDDHLGSALAGQLEDPSPQVRMSAARALSNQPFRGALPVLLKALGDADENVGYWASVALVGLGDYAIPQIVSCLADRSWRRRSMAARTLVRLGRRVVPAVQKALARPDRDARYWALEVLGELRVAEAAPVLLAHLEDPDATLVAAAARALGQVGDRQAVAPLLALLGHADEGVRLAAVTALGRFGDYSVRELTQKLDADSRLERLSSALALAAAGDVALGPLLTRLAEESSERRFWIVRALERLGNPVVVPVLLDLLEDEDPPIRRAAAQSLGSFALDGHQARRAAHGLETEDWLVRKGISDGLARQGHLSAGELAPLLESGTENQRFWLTKALASFASPESVHLLIERFDDPAWPIRKAAAGALARLGPVASGPLRNLLESDRTDPNTRYWASRALVGLQDSTLLPVLVKLLGDADPAVRGNAVDALEAQGPPALSELLGALDKTESRGVREQIARVLVKIGPAQTDTIAQLFEFRDLDLTYWAAWILGHIGRPALPTLLRLAADPRERTRYLAVSALTYIDAPESTEACLAALEDSYVSIRRLAVQALGRRRSAEALGPLKGLLGGAQHEFLVDIITSLGHVGDPGVVGDLVRFIDHERWEVRRAAVAALGRLGGPEASATLMTRLAREPGDLLPFIVEAVGAAGTREAVPALLVHLDSANVGIVTRTLSALAALGDPSVTSRCVALLASESWDIRRAALEALARIGAPFALDALRPILVGDDLVLRGLAQRALSAALGPERWQEAMQLTLQRALNDPAQEHYEEALARFERRDLSGALERVRKALRRVRKPEYYGLLGSIQLEQRRLGPALVNLRKAAATRDPLILYRLAVVYALGRAHRQASAILRALLRRPDLAADLRELAQRTLGRLRPVRKGP